MSTAMEPMLSQFVMTPRANQGIIVGLVLCLAIPLVLGLVALIMRAAGASLRPIVFLAVLMMPFALIFLVGQLVTARVPAADGQGAPGLEVRHGRFVERERLFGADVNPEWIRDARDSLPGILDEAEAAEAAVTLGGETMLVAQFPGEEEARRAAAAYHRGFQLRGVSGDEERGWRAERGLQGDFVEMLRTGRLLFVWTGLTREACDARRGATKLDLLPSIEPAPLAPLFPALQPLAAVFEPLAMKLLGMALLVGLYTLWFFKGAAWVASVPPVPGAPVLSSGDMVSRLMAINDLDVPFGISRGQTPEELIADWRYADAKWVDHARAHGMRRTFRIRLALDESDRTVRATDYAAAYDWSAGRGGASLEWKAVMGLVFFQKEQRTVLGLQLDERDGFKPELTYTYKFDLDEMKSPIKEAVVRSGWRWRPTVWQGPRWLRWLTE